VIENETDANYNPLADIPVESLSPVSISSREVPKLNLIDSNTDNIYLTVNPFKHLALSENALVTETSNINSYESSLSSKSK